MTKLKLASIDDDKPAKITVTLPAALHRNLVAYAEILSKETGKLIEPAKLIAPMLEKFIASDRGFKIARHAKPNSTGATSVPKPFPKSASESAFRFPAGSAQSDKI
ncbi:DUF2274 domain-containing protein [Methylocystis sp. SC2]|uniref:DUF2274 domain-containing protein n=1 Tax=Methylocystis sp. (strain SC2) TaxID=187303 RepID=UPI00027AE8C9|nr:Conserved hypothetical protein [Methylocystis sp. SC2]